MFLYFSFYSNVFGKTNLSMFTLFISYVVWNCFNYSFYFPLVLLFLSFRIQKMLILFLFLWFCIWRMIIIFLCNIAAMYLHLVFSFNVIAFNWKENKKTISVVVVQVYGMSFICAFGSLLTAFIPSKSTNKRHFHVLRSFLHKEC